MEHEVLMRSTLTYNATYILEDCALEAKFHHKYYNGYIYIYIYIYIGIGNCRWLSKRIILTYRTYYDGYNILFIC